MEGNAPDMGIGNKVRNIFNRGKDYSTSLVLERVLKHYFERYGWVQGFSLDSRQKRVQFELWLKGETGPVTVFIDEYEVVVDDSKLYFIAKKARVSREWIELIVQEFVLGQKLLIPEKYARLAETIL